MNFKLMLIYQLLKIPIRKFIYKNNIKMVRCIRLKYGIIYINNIKMVRCIRLKYGIIYINIQS
ncbi:hypothetical protein GCM10008917_16130 [Paraclostridium tenue]|uniref:Uncharacterized protein n=1 Tax=Paraclostridium tenue TaxID=1737 RepID=A0ABN1M4M7_9FIRM